MTGITGPTNKSDFPQKLPESKSKKAKIGETEHTVEPKKTDSLAEEFEKTISDYRGQRNVEFKASELTKDISLFPAISSDIEIEENGKPGEDLDQLLEELHQEANRAPEEKPAEKDLSDEEIDAFLSEIPTKEKKTTESSSGATTEETRRKNPYFFGEMTTAQVIEELKKHGDREAIFYYSTNGRPNISYIDDGELEVLDISGKSFVDEFVLLDSKHVSLIKPDFIKAFEDKLKDKERSALFQNGYTFILKKSGDEILYGNVVGDQRLVFKPKNKFQSFKDTLLKKSRALREGIHTRAVTLAKHFFPSKDEAIARSQIEVKKFLEKNRPKPAIERSFESKKAQSEEASIEPEEAQTEYSSTHEPSEERSIEPQKVSSWPPKPSNRANAHNLLKDLNLEDKNWGFMRGGREFVGQYLKNENDAIVWRDPRSAGFMLSHLSGGKIKHYEFQSKEQFENALKTHYRLKDLNLGEEDWGVLPEGKEIVSHYLSDENDAIIWRDPKFDGIMISHISNGEIIHDQVQLGDIVKDFSYITKYNSPELTDKEKAIILEDADFKRLEEYAITLMRKAPAKKEAIIDLIKDTYGDDLVIINKVISRLNNLDVSSKEQFDTIEGLKFSYLEKRLPRDELTLEDKVGFVENYHLDKLEPYLTDLVRKSPGKKQAVIEELKDTYGDSIAAVNEMISKLKAL